MGKLFYDQLTPKLAEAIEVAALDAVEIGVESWVWPFAQARRADIDQHFAAQQSERAALREKDQTPAGLA